MIRRQARLRREYLHRKNEEIKERNTYERKQKILNCLEKNKPIPTELRKFTDDKFKEDLIIDQAQQEPESIVYEEYKKAGLYDPKIMITTSRSPSTRLVKFSKELKLMFPNSQKINRGSILMADLVALANNNGFTDLIMINENNGQPSQLVVSHLPHGPTAYFTLLDVKLRHDTKTETKISEAFPHLIFDNFKTKTGNRVETILKHLYPIPKADTKRVLSFVNTNDFISFRHHIFVQSSHEEVELEEIGPRFVLRCYEIKSGNLADADIADTEYAYKSYINTAGKKTDL